MVSLALDLFAGGPSVWTLWGRVILASVAFVWGLGWDFACVLFIGTLSFDGCPLLLFSSPSPCVGVWAGLGLCLDAISEQQFGVLIPLCSLCLFMHSAAVIDLQPAADAALSTRWILLVSVWLRHWFVIKRRRLVEADKPTNSYVHRGGGEAM